MPHPLGHYLDFWDYLDGRFWSVCDWFGQELTSRQLAWQPVPEIASIGWNLRHLGEMLDDYLTREFQVQATPVAKEPLVTMVDGSRDDGRFDDLPAITAYHRQLRPTYRDFLNSLSPDDLARPLSARPGAHSLAWAIEHIAEHESYHLGKCMLLRNLMRSRAAGS